MVNRLLLQKLDEVTEKVNKSDRMKAGQNSQLQRLPRVAKNKEPLLDEVAARFLWTLRCFAKKIMPQHK